MSTNHTVSSTISVPSPAAFRHVRDQKRNEVIAKQEAKVVKEATAKAAKHVTQITAKLSKGDEAVSHTIKGALAVRVREIVERHFRLAGWMTNCPIVVQTAEEATITVRYPVHF
jgi:hypothetical protein